MVSMSPYCPLIGGEDAAIRKTLAETKDIQVTGAGKAALVVIAVGGRGLRHGDMETIFREEQRRYRALCVCHQNLT